MFPISAKETQINEAIDAKEIRVIGKDAQPLGIMQPRAALRLAYDQGLDLVMMAATATPPVCKIMDYGKYCFERDKKEKEAKKKQQTVELKEIQLSCRIDQHDFDTKARHAVDFLKAGNKVRVVLKFKGREMSHMTIGRDMLGNFENACAGFGVVDKRPVLDGKFMSMVVNPVKADPKPSAADNAQEKTESAK